MSEHHPAVVAWASPPASVIRWTRPVKYMTESDSMRERPGEWAQFEDTPSPRSAYNLADNIRRGRLVAFAPAGSFEAIARSRTVWARYVGKEDA